MTTGIEGRWALVTGASSGIGVDIARELAARGANLVLVARRRDRLETLAAELRDRARVQVDVVDMDLGQPDAGAALHDRVAASGRTIDLLVNNAGYGLHGSFRDIAWADHAAMLRVDIDTLTQLTWLYAREMVARKQGRILLVSSIGGFQPSPWYAAYAAAKAYVLNLGCALAYELRGTGVTVTTLCPGATDTEFTARAGAGAFKGVFRLLLMTPAEVARVGVRGLLRGRRVVVPGLVNTVNAWIMRRLSLHTSTFISAKSLENG